MKTLNKEKVNILQLKRFNGLEEYQIIEVEKFHFIENKELSFDFHCKMGCLGAPLKDTYDGAAPSGEIWIRDIAFEQLSELIGKSFEIPYGYNEEINDWEARLYYGCHQEVDNGKVTFLKIEDKQLYFHFEGVTQDVIFHENPPTEISLIATFDLVF